MRELTGTEVDQVSGAFGPIGGAFIGGIGYLAFNGMTGQSYTFAGFAGSVVTGAVTSGFSALGQGLRGAAVGANIFRSTALGTLSGAATYGAIGSMSCSAPSSNSGGLEEGDRC